MTRRSLLRAAAISPLLRAAGKTIPIGLEMYSVRSALDKDLEGSIRRVAQMGYRDMEFYNQYDWTPEKTKSIRKLLDDLNVTCLSTHNPAKAFAPDGIRRAIDINSILGARYIVMASAGSVKGLDGWRGVAETLTKADEKFSAAKIHAGYHNHGAEFQAVEGKRPMEVLASNTPKTVMLQLDVGHCVQAGADPVAWMESNPGRTRSLHLKDWSADKQWETIFGEGVIDWKKVFAAAEKSGGVEFYLIEHEGHVDAPFDAAEKCLENYRKLHA